MARLRCPAEAKVRIIEELAHGTGTIEGMIGGQVMDLEAEHTKPDAQTLEYIHRAKTGALITASLLTGCYYAGAKATEIQRVREFGRAAGLAFQIADDILDVTQTSEQLGKTAGKDLNAEKVTYPSLYGLEQSEKMATQLINNACSALDSFGPRAETLKAIARYLVERKK
jgi:geranylgeranyl diphosphate synthase type II